MSESAECVSCSYYVYNDDYEEYECLASFDEDEYAALLSGRYKNCPYYRRDDEYGVVKKQM